MQDWSSLQQSRAFAPPSRLLQGRKQNLSYAISAYWQLNRFLTSFIRCESAKNKKSHQRRDLIAGPTGIEPATSGLTGRRSNQAELRSQSIKNLWGTPLSHFYQAACHGEARRAKTETTIPKISNGLVFFPV